MRYSGAYQIEKSREDKRLLRITLGGTHAVLPGEVVAMERGELALPGDFYVQETVMKCGETGRETTLSMRRLEE